MAKKKQRIHRDALTGRFTSKADAEKRPGQTVSEKREVKKKRCKK